MVLIEKESSRFLSLQFLCSSLALALSAAGWLAEGVGGLPALISGKVEMEGIWEYSCWELEPTCSPHFTENIPAKKLQRCQHWLPWCPSGVSPGREPGSFHNVVPC